MIGKPCYRPVVVLLLALASSTAAAQGRSDSAAARGSLERRVGERVAAVVKERLQLTDEQLRQLRDVNARFETRRRALLTREREARMGLRAQLRDREGADQQRIAAALDELLAVQRSRVDLVGEEQRELAKFMQPWQRAGYLALQDQMRRRIDEMRRARGGGPPGDRGPGRRRP